ncbi:hypothetical protein CHS0354_038873 [Potamilus streckersoni]|uniref:2'-phosphotransferase n=1 Tax=Potamilus streckersoni TaxID=2493646 RepID=A0AAE0VS57_9BIVA|nr:hypothetical protein CHS0354_038873 [Potamilus streckersoni]
MDTRLSRCMARILRHDTKGQHDEAGYMYVRDLLSRCEIAEYTEEDVKRVVENDSKTRFHLTLDEHGTLKVKATQGHTIGLKDPLLKEIRSHRDVREVLHGTKSIFWEAIRTKGLSRMKRDHIHFCEAETDVISGFPPGCDVVISIDLQKALNDGIKFFQSENKVILSPGNVNGIIPTKYFNNVYKRDTGQRLPF